MITFQVRGEAVASVIATIAILIGVDPAMALDMTLDAFATAFAEWAAGRIFWAEVLASN